MSAEYSNINPQPKMSLCWQNCRYFDFKHSAFLGLARVSYLCRVIRAIINVPTSPRPPARALEYCRTQSTVKYRFPLKCGSPKIPVNCGNCHIWFNSNVIFRTIAVIYGYSPVIYCLTLLETQLSHNQLSRSLIRPTLALITSAGAKPNSRSRVATRKPV